MPSYLVTLVIAICSILVYRQSQSIQTHSFLTSPVIALQSIICPNHCPNMPDVPPIELQETLALIKPDAFSHQDAIVQAIKDEGFNILQVLLQPLVYNAPVSNRLHR